MVAALEQRAEHEVFARVDPVIWQRDARLERSLPGRE